VNRKGGCKRKQKRKNEIPARNGYDLIAKGRKKETRLELGGGGGETWGTLWQARRDNKLEKGGEEILG